MAKTSDFLRCFERSYHKDGREIVSGEPLAELLDPKEDDQYGSDVYLRRIKSMIRTEVSNLAFMKGRETFEEANDFEIDDDFEDQAFEDSPYMQEVYLRGEPEPVLPEVAPAEPEDGSPPPEIEAP